jgi:hypothetical protein
MKKPIIVEFNGLPGLGKTTVANSLIEILNHLGYKTVNRRYRRNLFYTLHHPIPELFNLKLYKLVSDYAKSIKPRKKRTHLHFTNFYAKKYLSILKYSGADFGIVDEGLIQFLVAMAFQDRMPESDKAEAIVRKLKALGIKFVRVDCANDVETSVARVLSRPSRGLVFETMQKEELNKTMEAEALNFDYLRTVFSKVYSDQLVINIDTVNTDPIDNAKIIADKLLNL